MTEEQILKKAIKKADYSPVALAGYGWDTIFSHEFAKAFWGEKDMWYETPCSCGGKGIHANDDTHSMDCSRVKAERGYLFHLKQMVVEENPLKYLEKFLK